MSKKFFYHNTCNICIKLLMFILLKQLRKYNINNHNERTNNNRNNHLLAEHEKLLSI